MTLTIVFSAKEDRNCQEKSPSNAFAAPQPNVTSG
jgi:hypothetical protein